MDTALPPTGPGAVTLSRDFRRAGFDQAELRRLTQAGDLVRVRRGAYTEAAAGDPEGRHRQLIAATLPTLSGEACVSHQSAAVLHGLPMWADLLDRVHVIRPRVGGGRRGTVVHVHPAPLGDGDIIELNGMPVTSLARTVADCARTLSFTCGVGVGDAALRAGLTPDELAVQLEVATGRPGVPAARRTAAFLDGRAENFGESLSRVVLRRAGVPTPDLQFEVLGRSGEVVARTDSPGRSTGRSRSSTARLSTVGCTVRARLAATWSFARRSVRTCCVTSAGRSSGGSGPTCASPGC